MEVKPSSVAIGTSMLMHKREENIKHAIKFTNLMLIQLELSYIKACGRFQVVSHDIHVKHVVFVDGHYAHAKRDK